MNVSIIIPLHKPDENLINKIKESLKNQKFKGKKETIYIGGMGLAEAYNEGIRKSQYEIIVTLHQDCIPCCDNWLEKLIDPLKEKSIATTGAIFDVENKLKYYPSLDGKNCAYKKEVLLRVGCFDSKTFLNGGEDEDMFIKLSKIGKVEKSDCFVYHKHEGYLKKKAKYKTKQNANINGCLFRVHGFRVSGWWKALVRCLISPTYAYWFFRGFIKRKQDFRR